jgi:hypothetical protein
MASETLFRAPLAEQYRPSSWAAVCGQDKVVGRIQALAKRGLGGGRSMMFRRLYVALAKSGSRGWSFRVGITGSMCRRFNQPRTRAKLEALSPASWSGQVGRPAWRGRRARRLTSSKPWVS